MVGIARLADILKTLSRRAGKAIAIAVDQAICSWLGVGSVFGVAPFFARLLQIRHARCIVLFCIKDRR